MGYPHLERRAKLCPDLFEFEHELTFGLGKFRDLRSCGCPAKREYRLLQLHGQEAAMCHRKQHHRKQQPG